MRNLKEIFESHSGRLLHKWDHYFEVYERYFARYRGTNANILEIGISHGGSLEMWREYFGSEVNLFAVDVIPECKQFEDAKTKIFIGSQEDESFLAQLRSQLPELDLLIDDGGHTMRQQIVSFNNLFSQVKDGGIYLVEDTHTSYWRQYHGGYKRKGSFIEFAKDMVDQMHAWHINNAKVQPVNRITENVAGIAFYDSIVVVEKKRRKEPFHSARGTPTITPSVDPTLAKETILQRIRKKYFGAKESSYAKQFKK